MPGKCRFNDLWVHNSIFKSWVRRDPSCDTKAYCYVCKKSIDLITMGRSALVSHAKGKRHQDLMAAPVVVAGPSIFSYFTGQNSTKEEQNHFSFNTLSQFQQDLDMGKESQTQSADTPNTRTSPNTHRSYYPEDGSDVDGSGGDVGEFDVPSLIASNVFMDAERSKMVLREEQEQIKDILRQSITMLCKSRLPFCKGLTIDGLIGITLDENDVFLVKLDEQINSDSDKAQQHQSTAEANPTRRRRKQRRRSSAESSPENSSTAHPPQKVSCFEGNEYKPPIFPGSLQGNENQDNNRTDSTRNTAPQGIYVSHKNTTDDRDETSNQENNQQTENDNGHHLTQIKSEPEDNLSTENVNFQLNYQSENSLSQDKSILPPRDTASQDSQSGMSMDTTPEQGQGSLVPKFMITWRNVKKKLENKNGTIVDPKTLFQAVCENFGCEPPLWAKWCYFDDECKDYLDMFDFDWQGLAQRDLVKILIKEEDMRPVPQGMQVDPNTWGMLTGGPRQNPVNVMTPPTPNSNRNPKFLRKLIAQTASQTNIHDPNDTSWQDIFPGHLLSLGIVRLLDSNVTNPSLSTTEMSNITEATFLYWSGHGMFYPTADDYTKMAELLLQRFPCLAQGVNTDDSFIAVDPLKTWKNRFQYRFQNERGKMKHQVPELRDRAKKKSKTPIKKSASQEDIKTPEKEDLASASGDYIPCKIPNHLPERLEGIDEAKVLEMKIQMRTMLDDTEIDTGALNNLMELTMSDRRKWIVHDMSDISTAMVEWPMLFHGNQLLEEFKRISGGISIENVILEGLEKHAERLNDLVRTSRNGLIQECQRVMGDLRMPKYRRRDLMNCIALMAVPMILKDNVDLMLSKETPSPEVQVQIVYQKSLTEEQTFKVLVEGACVLETPSFPTACAGVVASHFVFYLPYGRYITKTCIFYQRMLCGLPDDNKTVKIKSISHLVSRLYSI